MKEAFQKANKRRLSMIGLLALVCALSISVYACAPNEQAQSQKENRAYMSQLNTEMDGLKERLTEFDTAVEQGNIITIKTKAGSALKSIEAIEALTPPDSLKNIHKQYVAGCTDLESALTAYVDLYAKVSDQSDESYNREDYPNDIKEIQDLYNKGIQELKDADSAAING